MHPMTAQFLDVASFGGIAVAEELGIGRIGQPKEGDEGVSHDRDGEGVLDVGEGHGVYSLLARMNILSRLALSLIMHTLSLNVSACVEAGDGSLGEARTEGRTE